MALPPQAASADSFWHDLDVAEADFLGVELEVRRRLCSRTSNAVAPGMSRFLVPFATKTKKSELALAAVAS